MNIPAQPSAVTSDFRQGDIVYYPAHGVGTVQTLERMQIEGSEHVVLMIQIPRERATLGVPLNQISERGLRQLSDVADRSAAHKIVKILVSKPKINRGTWHRRVQMYNQKITNGDLRLLAETARDLNRDPTNASYSELQVRARARDRLLDVMTHAWYCSPEAAANRINKALEEAERPHLYD